MRAMILAAGRGQRMGHLTEHTPKPLLKVNDRFLIEYSIEALQKIGVKEIVINVAYLGEQIKLALGDGSRYGVRFHYSEEREALETGGGIFQALPLLGDQPFIVLSCDVISDFPLDTLKLGPDKLAHLVMVDNPDFHPQGDFALEQNKVITGSAYTYANIGLLNPSLFAGCEAGKFALGPLLKKASANNLVTGEYYSGRWYNLGTPQQLVELND